MIAAITAHPLLAAWRPACYRPRRLPVALTWKKGWSSASVPCWSLPAAACWRSAGPAWPGHVLGAAAV